MKTFSWEKSFSGTCAAWERWRDAAQIVFDIEMFGVGKNWGNLRLSTADGEKSGVLLGNSPEDQLLGNEAVIRIHWYSEPHFWITEATKLPDDFVLNRMPVEGHLRSCIGRDDKQADFALVFAVRQNGSESIWAVWGFLEEGDTLDDIQTFFEYFGEE